MKGMTDPKRASLILALVSLPLLFSCDPERPSFHHLDDGIAFRRVTMGRSGPRVGVGDAVKLVHRATPVEDPDSTLSKDSSYLLLDAANGGLTKMLRTMSEGDSSIFKLDSIEVLSGQLSALEGGLGDPTGAFRLEIRILERRKPSALLEWKQKKGDASLEARWKEWARIREFVSDLDPDPEEHFVQGIYMFPGKRGRGPKVKVGRKLSVHYKGFLPDSSVFDDSYKRGEPLRFHFGDPKQVIKGVEIGLQFMREGGKAKLVIPSYLAFGKKGGDTGILPPHTFVCYKIEVVDVKTS